MNDPAPSSGLPTSATPPPLRARVLEVAAVFARLGFTAFGGPAVHVGLIEDQVVARRKWVDRREFMDAVAAVNFIPGPNSTELCIHLGYRRAGFAGLVVAGVCFIVPAMLIILPIAWAYVNYGALPRVGGMMAMISCAVVAVVAVAAWRFTRTSLTDGFRWIIAILAAAIALALTRFPQFQPELVALGVAALLGIGRELHASMQLRFPMLMLAPPMAAAYAIGQTLPRSVLDMGRLALLFLKIGATLFGSGYVLVSYMRSGLVVDHGWLTEQQLLDAIAVGQFTPGPLLTSATFAGYVVGANTFGGGHVGGVVGAVVATAAIFLPSFCFVAVLGPVLGRIRRQKFARAALDAMNAAVAALLVIVTAQLAISSIRGGGWPGAVVLAASAAALFLNVNATWVILTAGAIGLAFS